MLNSIVIMGRLTADPELKTTNSGISVCSFNVAVDRNYQQQGEEKQTDFITVVTWRGTADFVARYFAKGSMIVVQGSLQSRKWKDKDGNNRVSWEVQADRVFFDSSKKETATTEQQQEEETFTPMQPDEDLPF